MNKQMINGIEIAYEDLNREHKETIVLLHGFCGSSAYWKSVNPFLSEKYRILQPDFRGHGGSGMASEEVYSMELLADDLKHLLDHLELTEIVLFGHSLGGYVTLAFAEKYPEYLKGFSLIHSTARPDDTEGKEKRLLAIEAIRENGLPPFIDSLVPKLFAPKHAESMPEAIAYSKLIGLQTKPEAAIATLKGMRKRPDRNPVLRKSDVPILLVAGADDQIIPVSKTFSIEGKHITPIKLSHSGHMSMLEAPEQLSTVMETFMQKLK